VAVAALGAYGLLACTLVVSSDELTQGCPEGFKRCDIVDLNEDGFRDLTEGDGPGCVSVDDPDYGCNDPNSMGTQCRPCSLTHATPICGPGGQCVVGGCDDSEYADCDDTPGCETHVASDVNHCRTCDTNCETLPWPNVQSRICANFNCAIFTCQSGYADCDKVAASGCECNTADGRECCGPRCCNIGDGQHCCGTGNQSKCCDANEACVDGDCVPM